MNDVYACLLIAKEAAITIFFVVLTVGVIKTCWKKETKTDEEKKNG